jgi:hypothetical protein
VIADFRRRLRLIPSVQAIADLLEDLGDDAAQPEPTDDQDAPQQSAEARQAVSEMVPESGPGTLSAKANEAVTNAFEAWRETQ